MKIIVCLDERNGMLFNHRRQSRDQSVISDILSIIDGSTCRLFISPYSVSLFEEQNYNQKIVICDTPTDIAGEGDYYFIENLHISNYIDKIDEIIVYKWNRRYPGDFYFDIDYTDVKHWQLNSSVEFAGNSHEKITKEIYTHVQK